MRWTAIISCGLNQLRLRGSEQRGGTSFSRMGAGEPVDHASLELEPRSRGGGCRGGDDVLPCQATPHAASVPPAAQWCRSGRRDGRRRSGPVGGHAEPPVERAVVVAQEPALVRRTAARSGQRWRVSTRPCQRLLKLSMSGFRPGSAGGMNHQCTPRRRPRRRTWENVNPEGLPPDHRELIVELADRRDGQDAPGGQEVGAERLSALVLAVARGRRPADILQGSEGEKPGDPTGAPEVARPTRSVSCTAPTAWARGAGKGRGFPRSRRVLPCCSRIRSMARTLGSGRTPAGERRASGPVGDQLGGDPTRAIRRGAVRRQTRRGA